MDIIISPFERAVCDAVALLTRSRFSKDAPLYLVKPKHPLRISVTHKTRSDGEATVGVECDTWGEGTWLMLTLSLMALDGNWLAWGPFGIKYSPAYPVSLLAGKTLDSKEIYPMYAHRPDAVRHQELRIRTHVVR